MSAETPGVTPRTPGLDPERLAVAVEALSGDEPSVSAILAADDALARSRGLVATGDAVPVWALAVLRSAAQEHADLDHGHRYGRSEACKKCRGAKAIEDALAALPSSLLDNPEADRGE